MTKTFRLSLYINNIFSKEKRKNINDRIKEAL